MTARRTTSRPDPRRGSRRRSGAAAGLALAAALAGFAATTAGPVQPAAAHNRLVDSVPEAGEALAQLPPEFSITTNEDLLALPEGEIGGFAVDVVGPDGLHYSGGCPTIAGPTMSVPAGLGPAGDYELTWQLVSADGHTVSDSFGFSWVPPAGVAPTSGAEEAVPCGEAEQPSVDGSEDGSSGGSDDTAPDPGDRIDNASPAMASDAPWIVGAVLAVAVAVIVTVLLLRRPRGVRD